MSDSRSDLICRVPRTTAGGFQKPTEALWASYKDHLKDVFMTQDKSVAQVRFHMLETHSFQASLQQYHRMFRKWDFQKNMKSEQWQEVSKAVKRRRLKIDQMEVWYKGELISRKRVKKALPRYDRPTLQSTFSLSTSVSAETVSMTTSASASAGNILIRVALDPSMSIPSPARLPWFSFVEILKRKARIFELLGEPSLDSHRNLELHGASSSGPSSVTSLTIISEPSVRSDLTMGDYLHKHYLDLEPLFPGQQSGDLLNCVKMLTQHKTVAAHTSLAIYAAYLLANNLGCIPRKGICAQALIIEWIIQWVTSVSDMGFVFLEQLRSMDSSVARSVIDKLLYIAIHDGHLELLQIMMKVGTDPDRVLNHPAFGACTPLQIHLANVANLPISLSITRCLLEAGADPNLCGKHGRNEAGAATYCCSRFPLSEAIARHDGAAIDALVKHGSCMYSTQNLADVSSSDVSLVLTIRFLDIINNIEQANPDLTQPGYLRYERRGIKKYLCPLQASCASGDVRLTSVLLERGADPNGINVRKLAVWFPDECHNPEDTSQCLLNLSLHRGQICMLSPLASSIANGQSEIVRMLLRAGVDVNRCLWGDLIDFWATADSRHPAAESHQWIEWTDFGSADVRKLGVERPCVATPLQAACARSDNYTALELLRLGADPNPSCGTPPLVIAALAHNTELVLHLVRYGARPSHNTDRANNIRFDALTAAALMGSIEIMEVLVNAGAPLDAEDCTYKTPLAHMLTCARFEDEGAFRMARRLILLGANVNHSSIFAEAVRSTTTFDFILATGLFSWEGHATETLDLGFEIAVDEQNYAIAKIILERMEKLRSDFGRRDESLSRTTVPRASTLFATDGPERLRAASWWLRYLLYRGDRYKTPPESERENCWWSRPGCKPVEKQDQAAFLILIEYMISRGADLNALLCPLCLTPLCMATTRATDVVIKTLFSHGARSRFGSAHHGLELCRASVEGDLRMVEMLLDHGAPVSAPINFAELVSHRRNSCFKLHGNIWRHDALGEAYGDMCAGVGWMIDCEEVTPLQLAYTLDNDEVAELLVVRGADVNIAAASKGRGRTALQRACERGNLEMVHLLLNYKADVNAPADHKQGVTALQAAAVGGYFAIVQTLVAMGADVAAPASMEEGRTAIDGAAEHGRLDIVAFLLDNYRGATPLRVLCRSARRHARNAGHMNVVEYLASYPREQGDVTEDDESSEE